MTTKSPILLQHLKEHNLTKGCITNFHPLRGCEWKLDFAWPASMLAVEVRLFNHEKHSSLTRVGWRILYFTHHQVADGFAVWSLLQMKKRGISDASCNNPG
jgi:hypothetical protein